MFNLRSRKSRPDFLDKNKTIKKEFVTRLTGVRRRVPSINTNKRGRKTGSEVKNKGRNPSTDLFTAK